MDVTHVLSRLTRVRATGRQNWVACCPAHEDRTPSMTITETKDGRILLHCFAGCSTSEIVGALGLSLRDLFADSPHERGYVTRRPQLSAIDALRGLAQESAVIALLASDLADGKPIKPEDADRGFTALGRIVTALEAVEHGC